MRSSRLTITHTHELTCELSASVSPGSPEVRDVESPMCGPATGPEVDDVRLELTRGTLQSLRDATYREPNFPPLGINRHPLGDLTDAQIAEFTLAILRALDPEFATGRADEAFVEALGTERERREAAADDAAEARAEHRKLHPDDYRYPLYLEED